MSKRRAGGQRRREDTPAEAGDDLVFEDQFEDEEDEEELLVEEGMGGNDGESKEGMGMAEADEGDEEEGGDKGPMQVYRPGIDELGEGEVLDYDSSAYKLYHAMNVEWPCLSFDIVQDRLGEGRTKVRARCACVRVWLCVAVCGCAWLCVDVCGCGCVPVCGWLGPEGGASGRGRTDGISAAVWRRRACGRTAVAWRQDGRMGFGVQR